MPTIAELLLAYRDRTGDSYQEMARKVGDEITAARFHQLTTSPPKEFPKHTRTIELLSRLLEVPWSATNWRVRFYEGIEDARKARPELDIPRHSPHALRHTAASWLVQDGVPLYDVQRLLGHESFAVTQKYAHLAPDSHGAVERSWDRLLAHQRRTGGGRPPLAAL